MAPSVRLEHWGDVAVRTGKFLIAAIFGTIATLAVSGAASAQVSVRCDTDPVNALNSWVQNGKAPDQIPAARIRNGAPDRTRPLCPYPQVAHYQGSGNTDDAANFACK